MLALEQEVAVVEHRDDHRRARVNDVLAGRFGAVGQAHPVLLHMQQAAAIFVAGIQRVFGEVGSGHGLAKEGEVGRV